MSIRLSFSPVGTPSAPSRLDSAINAADSVVVGTRNCCCTVASWLAVDSQAARFEARLALAPRAFRPTHADRPTTRAATPIDRIWLGFDRAQRVMSWLEAIAYPSPAGARNE